MTTTTTKMYNMDDVIAAVVERLGVSSEAYSNNDDIRYEQIDNIGIAILEKVINIDELIDNDIISIHDIRSKDWDDIFGEIAIKGISIDDLLRGIEDKGIRIVPNDSIYFCRDSREWSYSHHRYDTTSEFTDFAMQKIMDDHTYRESLRDGMKRDEERGHYSAVASVELANELFDNFFDYKINKIKKEKDIWGHNYDDELIDIDDTLDCLEEHEQDGINHNTCVYTNYSKFVSELREMRRKAYE